MLAAPESMTAAQLLAYRDPADRRTELVRGRLVVSEPPGWEHGAVVARVAFALSLFVREAAAAGEAAIGAV
ncbi:MAG TPA: Uma2 family endonuclease, partial [Gemmatimonadaceae bacterium]|nr:Uma2 family endonuclease [Gemmatimonadaceae bacterium]